jgi:hypothetical protein
MSKIRLINLTKVNFFLVIFVVIKSHADAENDANETDTDNKDNSYAYEEYDAIHSIMKISGVEPHSMKIVIDPKTLKLNTSVGITLRKLNT